MELEGCNNDKEVYHALKTVPHSLEDTYRKILDRIQKKDVDIARGIFSLLCLSPVTLDLETVAAMVDITVSAVVRICTTSLVSVFEGKIQFAHFSVQEFIVLSGELEVVSHHPCQFTILSGQFELAERTVDCLLGQTEELDQFQALERPAFLYSARYWSTHLAACGDISQTHPEIQSKVNRIFTTPTVYFNWIRAADSDSSWDNPWSKLLKECPAPLHKATSLALLRTVECLVTEGADPAGYSSSNMFRASPFFLAARLGHLDILQLFLDKTPFPQKELRYLLANFECANADKPKLEKVLRTLWDQGLLCGQSPDLTNTLSEKVLADVARRCDSGIAMLDIFLDWRPEIRVPVTEEFITLAICEKNVPRECLHLLFKRCDIHMPYISKSSMSNRVSFTGSLPGVAYVAEEWPDKLEIFDLLLARFAEYEPPTVFESLLKHRKEDTPVTQDVLEKAANNSRYPNMLLSLWSHRQPDTKVTDSMVKHATLRTIHSEELLRFTLEGFRLHSTLAEETVSSCLYFCTDGVATLKMLIEYTPSSLWTSEELVERICAHAHAVGMLDLLAQIDGFCVPITEDILRYAAGNVNGPFVVRSLAQMQKNPFEVTENVILAAVENRDSGAEVIRSLMQDASPDIWTDAVFEGACENKEVMVLLLDQNRKDLPIEKMLEALKESSNVFESKDTLQVLLERNILQVDEHLIETLASSSTLLDCMLLFNPDVHITHKALLSATANCRSMRLIMGARGNSLPVTDDVLVAAIEAYSDKEMFQLVLDRQGSLPITHKIIEKGLEYRMIVGWLLELVPESDLEKLWQPTWCDTQLAVEDRVQNLLAILFIQRSKMTDGMLEMFPYDPEDGENYGFDELVEMLCTDDDDDIPALSGTERAAEIILERCNNEMIEMFVHCDRYSCSITDNLIQAAGRNRIADQEKLMAFLEQERS